MDARAHSSGLSAEIVSPSLPDDQRAADGDPSPATQPWCLSWRADPVARAIADRHYNRQKVGAPQFVPPGRCVVLTTPDSTVERGALWVSSWPYAEYVQHAWAGAWVCSAFRNETPDLYLSSDLIRAALAATVAVWPAVPELGMVTFVDRAKTRPKRDPGRCFLRAGFRYAGETKGGLVALVLPPGAMPVPLEALGTAQRLAV